MLSCDTLVLTADFSAYNSNMLAKNSDRPLGESQPLVWVPAADHSPGDMLQCTYISIPQAAHTYGILGSKPYWIWGFEMGVNEKGVAIANEAQGSRAAAETETGLLGMDLLRLGLERGSSAAKALKVITGLLAEYGQNANACPLFDRRYENSYMIVDSKEAWLLETAGRDWAAKQIHDRAAISNCYIIEEDYDIASPCLVSNARSNGWISPQEPFNFAKAYTLPAVRQTNSVPRLRRLIQLSDSKKSHDFSSLGSILRDHFENELMAPRFGAGYGTFPTICMHAMTWDSSQTAASMLVGYREVLGPVMRHAFSIPCCSLYLPVYCTGYLPLGAQIGGEFYDSQSLWWLFERLAMIVSADSDLFSPQVRQAAHSLELQFDQAAAHTEALAVRSIKEGNPSHAMDLLNRLMDDCAEKAVAFAGEQFQLIRAQLAERGGLAGPRQDFLLEYCRRVHMTLL